MKNKKNAKVCDGLTKNMFIPISKDLPKEDTL